jgi:tetratricopeptide (TPR) repeat protein
MYRHDLARLLVLEYLEFLASSDPALSSQYNFALSSLQSIWGTSRPSHPGCPSLADIFSALPDQIESEYRTIEAQVALGRGDFDDARRAFLPLIRVDQPSSTALKDRGAALLKQGLWVEAIADCEMAIEIDPRNPVGHLRLIYGLLSMDRKAEGRRAYERAVKCCPNDEALNDLAVVIGPAGEN